MVHLSKHFKTSLPEGVKCVGSPDVRAQHVKGTLLVAILGGRERWLVIHQKARGAFWTMAQPIPQLEVAWLCT